ncbi:MAG: sulfatase-like hydrolase/transferase [Planctomycetes bacterium]|nr:sulfatase-like hydrolase/transferase [Planctomycetota bacterium]
MPALLRTSCALLALAACGPSTPERVDSVILITLDTTRADALGCYGGQERATPNLTALASESRLFERARSVAPLTAPAHASMLTGLIPPRHGVRDNGIARLPSDARTLAERARDAGLDTAAFVSALVLDRRFGLDQGFDVYDQPEPPKAQLSSHYVERDARATLAAATRWLAERDDERRFFVWIHLFDAHVPYRPPDECLALAGGDPYRGELAYVDRELGAFLAGARERGELDRSLLIVVGDHGESLGEHGEATHSAFCYDATLAVPLLVRDPHGFGAGERSRAIVSVVDVFPTALAALGLAAPEGFGALGASGAPRASDTTGSEATHDGLDLRGSVPADRGVYCESYSGYLNYGWSPLAGVADADAKFLASSEPELYDLVRDPHERTNHAAERAQQVDAAKQRLAEFLARPALAPEPFGASAELIAELRELGYAASGDAAPTLPSPLAPSDRPSPRSRAAELEPLLLANDALDGRRWEDARHRLEPIVAANPKHALAHDLAALAALQLSDFTRAKELLTARLALGAERADTRINLAIACENLGELPRAEREWRRALELDPLNSQAVDGLAALCERTGRNAEAAELRASLQSRR